MTNYNRDIFVDACYQAGIVPSKRQESKFRNGKGLAFAARISEAQRRKSGLTLQQWLDATTLVRSRRAE